jgi:1-acyl-sn-glycerol-3-phosphate acyltransferase
MTTPDRPDARGRTGVGARIQRLVALAGWRLARLTFVGEPPPRESGIIVAAPHTSNWDYLLMLGVTWRSGIRPRFLVKKETFKGPLGWLMKATGGIPVDRQNPAGTVRALLEEARGGEPFLLVIAAEGTRSKGEYWKSGFYRLATQADLPVTIAFVDGPTRTCGFGPTFTPSGDVRADMDLVRAFLADKHGLRPANRTEPRLREESPR